MKVGASEAEPFWTEFLHSLTRRGLRGVVSALVRTIFAQTSEKAAREQWRVVADQLRERFPKIGALMDEAEPEVLAHMKFPREHHSKIYSTNSIERLNGEWALCRRYMSLETLAEHGHNPSVSLPAVAD